VMANTMSNQYLRQEILSADPMKLVCMLYRGAIEAVRSARNHLRERRIRERSRQITKAYEIIHELARALDPEHAEITLPLAQLYAYMLTRLTEANTRQIEPPLEDVERLLTTLLEGWQSAAPIPIPAQDHEVCERVSCTY
jgi:flagellar protein FliS